MDYEYFISFRKQDGIGGEIANNVYDVLGEYLKLSKTDLKNKCYFSPENSETGDDFRKNEIDALSKVKYFILVLSKDIFDWDIGNRGEEIDEIKVELEKIFKRKDVTFICVAQQGFNWKSDEILNNFLKYFTEDDYNRLYTVAYLVYDHSNFNNDFLKTLSTAKSNRIMERLGKIEWDECMAKTWENIVSPSKPSPSELAIYKEYLLKIKNNIAGQEAKMLILGTTNEFRDLAQELDFTTYIVDNSKSYYNERSKNRTINPEKEIFVESNWIYMSDSLKLKNNMFDVVIGDLAIGNVCPTEINRLMKNIYDLLKEGGYYLGKSIFSYQSEKINNTKINEVLEEYFKKKADNPNISAFASAMYYLSVYAKEEGDTENYSKIAFHKIAYPITSYIDKNPNHAQDEISTIFANLGKKMNISFYVYDIGYYVGLCKNYFDIQDVRYGKDIYSKNFPLIIFKKKSGNAVMNGADDFIPYLYGILRQEDKKEYIKLWQNSLSSLYFLIKLNNISHGENRTLEYNVNKVVSMVKENLEVDLNDKLLLEFKEYNDKTIESESKQFTREDCSENSVVLEMRLNYSLAILCYVTSKLPEVVNYYKNSNSAFSMIVKRLFMGDRRSGNLWKPTDELWISAKVLLCLGDAYSSWGNSENKEDKNNRTSINDALSYIISSFPRDVLQNENWWNCKLGSDLDNKALCCEVLLDYYNKLKHASKQNIMTIFKKIYNYYLDGNKIHETLIRFSIGENLIEEVLSDENDKTHKVLTGRIEWLSILLRIAIFISKYDKQKQLSSDAKEKTKLLVSELTAVWSRIMGKENEMIKKLSKQEIAAFPQIVYSLVRAFNDLTKGNNYTHRETYKPQRPVKKHFSENINKNTGNLLKEY